MAQHGELIEWNDERGYGFIRPAGGNERLFVHISQIVRIATRPRVGDRVSFAIGRGREGKPAAIDVSIIGANPINGVASVRGFGQKTSHRLAARHIVAVALAILVLAGAVMGSVPWLLAIFYLAMGAVSAAFYSNDKRIAQDGGWRISEASLHGVDLAFGIIGGLLAQQLFRHKTAKLEFAITTYAIAALHGLLLLGLLSGRLSLDGLIPG